MKVPCLGGKTGIFACKGNEAVSGGGGGGGGGTRPGRASFSQTHRGLSLCRRIFLPSIRIGRGTGSGMPLIK